jgi:hypothetical protein
MPKVLLEGFSAGETGLGIDHDISGMIAGDVNLARRE